jgi:oxygen-dependent protoporphyrinogen oxidase
VRKAQVLIVGGGISGLNCAYTLASRSVEFLLLERQERLGGTIRTERVDDFLLDAGPDAFLTQKTQALALCRELGLESSLIPTNPSHRNVYVWHGGRLHALPEGMVLTVPTRIVPFALSSLFSLRGKLRMGLELFVPRRESEEEESISSFVERRLGREALDRLAEPLLAGIHSGDPDRLSMDQLFPRFVALEKRYGSLIRGMRKAKPRRNPRPQKTVFMSLAEGLSRLVDALAGKLPSDSVLSSKQVQRIRREGSHYIIETSEGEQFCGQALVLSLPVREAGRLTEELSSELSDHLHGYRSVSTAVVFLGFRREDVRHPLDGYGFVVPASESGHLLASTFVSTKFPNRAPDSHVLLRGFIGGARDPAVLERTDLELAELVRRELGSILGDLPKPSFFRVYRWMGATPQVEVGHGDRLAALDRLLDDLPGLQITGNGLRGVGIPDCIADSRLAAEKTMQYLESKAAEKR